MFSRCALQSATLRGVEAVPVTVEVVISAGLPGMSIVGMPDTAVKESKERIRAAIKAAGFSMPYDKIVVNLAPASVRKTGSGFDLPIALGILVASHQIPDRLLRDRLFVGELSLDGGVSCVTGMMAYGIAAQRMGLGLVCASCDALAPLHLLEMLFLNNLMNLYHETPFQEPCFGNRVPAEHDTACARDFSAIAGHDVAKRALQIAAAGRHGVLMTGPPGSGKTMLASRLPSILPPLTYQEMIETAVVHSVAGEDISSILAGIRPFRHPHHSASSAGLVGGGSPIRPGEISLAHHGVLFLDELPEFKTSVLQTLRQPLESGEVSITRADGTITFPSSFMLIGAANPCPCGYLGDEKHACSCTDLQVRQYQAKVGGPLMDRVSIQLDVDRVDPASVLASGQGTSSETLREGVLRARAFAQWRRKHTTCANDHAPLVNIEALGEKDELIRAAQQSPKNIIDECRLSSDAYNFALSMATVHSLSARCIINMLSVARTIADMSEKEAVSIDHIAEALGYRVRQGIGGV